MWFIILLFHKGRPGMSDVSPIWNLRAVICHSVRSHSGGDSVAIGIKLPLPPPPYPLTPPPRFSPSLISLMVSLDVKHRVYFLRPYCRTLWTAVEGRKEGRKEGGEKRNEFLTPSQPWRLFSDKFRWYMTLNEELPPWTVCCTSFPGGLAERRYIRENSRAKIQPRKQLSQDTSVKTAQRESLMKQVSTTKGILNTLIILVATPPNSLNQG